MNGYVGEYVKFIGSNGKESKHDNLVRLGIPDSKAWEWANSRLGYWRIAHSWILTRSLTNKYLTSVGYDDISKRYEVLHLNH